MPFFILGGLLAALALGLGAIGAHALKSPLAPEQLATFHTAVQYQMYHAIGLVLVGLLSLHQRSRWFEGAGWSMLIGHLVTSIEASDTAGRSHPVPISLSPGREQDLQRRDRLPKSDSVSTPNGPLP
jgi:hypothetical protein